MLALWLPEQNFWGASNRTESGKEIREVGVSGDPPRTLLLEERYWLSFDAQEPLYASSKKSGLHS